MLGLEPCIQQRDAGSWGQVGGGWPAWGNQGRARQERGRGFPLGVQRRSLSMHLFSRVASESHRHQGPSRDAPISHPPQTAPWERHWEVGTEGRKPRGMFNVWGHSPQILQGP